jgi:hypothetical protein
MGTSRLFPHCVTKARAASPRGASVRSITFIAITVLRGKRWIQIARKAPRFFSR